MRYTIRSTDEECACERCGAPMYISDVVQSNARGNVFCSVSCLDSARMKEIMTRNSENRLTRAECDE